MTKRFILFFGCGVPDGGWEDIHDSYNTFEDAIERAMWLEVESRDENAEDIWWQIVDQQEDDVVKRLNR